MSGPSPHPGPCMPLLLLIAPVGPPHSPEKIQNILSEATWPQEKIGANRIRHVVQLIQSFPPHQNADLGTAKYFFFLRKKSAQLHSCGFCTPISSRLGQILLSIAK